jgi:hypothetical protein
MPTPTYTALANLTLSSAASTITFGSIPATYRDLVVTVQGNTSANSAIRMTFNSDSGTNYFWQRLSTTGAAAPTAAAATNSTFVNLANIPLATTTSAIQIMVNVMDYSATDKHKSALSRSGNAANGVEVTANRWANTSAITSIQVTAATGSWAIGSTFALYGIAS